MEFARTGQRDKCIRKRAWTVDSRENEHASPAGKGRCQLAEPGRYPIPKQAVRGYGKSSSHPTGSARQDNDVKKGKSVLLKC